MGWGEFIVIGAGWVGVMEGGPPQPLHLHLALKQIVFVPLYFAIDRYLPFVCVPLPNSPSGCGGWGFRGMGTAGGELHPGSRKGMGILGMDLLTVRVMEAKYWIFSSFSHK